MLVEHDVIASLAVAFGTYGIPLTIGQCVVLPVEEKTEEEIDKILCERDGLKFRPISSYADQPDQTILLINNKKTAHHFRGLFCIPVKEHLYTCFGIAELPMNDGMKHYQVFPIADKEEDQEFLSMMKFFSFSYKDNNRKMKIRNDVVNPGNGFPLFIDDISGDELGVCCSIMAINDGEIRLDVISRH